MANDLVVKVRNIECSVGAKLKVDRPEPGIIAGEKIGLFDGPHRSTMAFDSIAIDATRHDVSAKEIFFEDLGERTIPTDRQTADGCAAVQMFHNGGDEPQAIVGLSETFIATAADKLCDRFTVTICGKEVAPFVFCHSKWIDLTKGKVFDA